MLERTPEKFVAETVSAARRARALSAAADIGRNNGVCSDPEISLLTVDGQQRRISGAPVRCFRGGTVDIGLSYVLAITLYLPYFMELYSRFSNEVRDSAFPSIHKYKL